MKLARILLAFGLTIILSHAFAQGKFIPLYPDAVPNSKKAPVDYTEKLENAQLSRVTVPGITAFFPPAGKANGTAVIICPGGGYGWLAIKAEGDDVAITFTELGVTAFVLKYRLPSDLIMEDRSLGPLQDAQRAMQLIRKNSVEWGIDPKKVGMIGFSAGGHLVATAGTHFNNAVISNPDSSSLRPDFMLLIYPVITMGRFTHEGSKVKLIGKDASAEQISRYSGELQVTEQTPLTFMVHAEDDIHVPPQNTLMFYEALLKFKVKAELHIYQAGGHGFNLNNLTTPDDWFERCRNFLKQNKFL